VLDLGTQTCRGADSGGPQARRIAMARDGGTAYVTVRKANMSRLIEHCVGARSTAKIAIPDTPLGSPPDPSGGLSMSPASSPRLYKIDLAAAAIVATVEVGASPSASLCRLMGALDRDGRPDDDQISIIDAKSFTRQKHRQVGAAIRFLGRTIRRARRARLCRECEATMCPSSISGGQAAWHGGGR